MNKKYKISIVDGVNPGIKSRTDFLDLLKLMTESEDLISRSKKIRELYLSSPEGYEKMKFMQPGFIFGDWTYRDEKCLTEYTPLLGFDLDKIKTKEVFDSVVSKLKAWDYSKFVLPSLSGLGIRLIVETDSTYETHVDYYSFICQEIKRVTGLKLKSNIREGLKIAGYKPSEINEELKVTPHVDDSMSNASRFWYYSGLKRSEIYYNAKNKIYSLKPKSQPQNNSSQNYVYEFTQMDKVNYLVDLIAKNRIDITSGVIEWFKIGCALANEFGEQGRSIFHAVCQFHKDYKYKTSDDEFSRCLKKQNGKVTIATFYKFCDDYGIGIDWKDLTKSLASKIEKKKAVSVTLSKSGVPQKIEVEKHAPVQVQTDIDLEAERCLVSRLINDSDLYFDLLDKYPKFSNSYLSAPYCVNLFKAIEKCVSAKMPIDLGSVSKMIQSLDEKITIDEIARTVKENRYNINFENASNIVYTSFVKREVLRISGEIEKEVYETDKESLEIIDDYITDLTGVIDTSGSKTQRTFYEVISSCVSIQDKRIENFKSGLSKGVTGVDTGFNKLNALTLGYQPTQLIFRAARPGMGKTATMLHTAKEAAKQGKKVGIFSLEMSSEQLVDRMISSESKVSLSDLKSGKLSKSDGLRYNEAIKNIANLPIYIDDKAGANINYISRTIAKWKRQHGLDFVIIDYLGLIKPSNRYKGNTNKEVGEISNELKGIAKKFKIPVLCLAQLSRSVETRGGDKRPILSDLRDSGEIEQDADIVEFLYRPEYYNILENEEGVSMVGLLDIIVAKNRDGALDTVKSFFEKEFMNLSRFYNSLDSVREKTKEKTVLTVVDDLEDVPESDPNKITRSNRQNDDDIPF